MRGYLKPLLVSSHTPEKIKRAVKFPKLDPASRRSFPHGRRLRPGDRSALFTTPAYVHWV